MHTVESEHLSDREPDSIPVVPSAQMANTDSIPTAFDPRQLRAGRLERLRGMMADQGYAAVVLFDPYNQRYATGSRNMFGYFLRNSTRYIYVPLKGPVILFEYPGSAHVSSWLETIDESRTSKVVWSAVNQRDNMSSDPFGTEIAELVREHGEGNLKVGLDRCPVNLARALEAQGLEVFDCMQDTLYCRRIKTPEEIACLAQSMAGSEAAVAEVEAAIKPGVTENDLFATLYGNVIKQGGEFIETRLLNSGPRTNPWFNEASNRVVRPGELICLDTDTIGCHGYYSDFSRTFHVGPGKPTRYQQQLYRMAYEQVHHNMSILKPGMSYREIAGRFPIASLTGGTPRSFMASGCTARRRSWRTTWISIVSPATGYWNRIWWFLWKATSAKSVPTMVLNSRKKSSSPRRVSRRFRTIRSMNNCWGEKCRTYQTMGRALSSARPAGVLKPASLPYMLY